MSTEPEGNEEELVEEPSSEETQDEKEETQETESTEEETDEEVVEEEEEETEKPLSRAEQRIKEALAERDAYKRMAEARSQRESVVEEALPEMDPELEVAVNARLKKIQDTHNRQLGAVIEGRNEDKFDAYLDRSGLKADKIASIKETVQEFREEKGSKGIYFTHQEAFDLLRGKGAVKLPTPGKKVSVVKSKPKFGSERKTSVNTKVSSKKSFEKMTLDEKEKSLDGKTF